ncbi:MAG: hypothetical protein IJ189_03180 [Clostridia bacterium]|nr:hypothetical protein [Clostridia bacterium]
MPKWSSLVGRFVVQMIICVLLTAILSVGLSSYFFHDSYSGVSFGVMRESLRDARRLLSQYQEGKITQEALRQAVNPVLTTDGGFFMLLDLDQNVLAYTESAAPYFAGDTLPSLLSELEQERSATVRKKEGNTRVLMMGEKSAAGYALIGRPTRIFRGVAANFRIRLLVSMGAILLVVVLTSLWATRRAAKASRMITQMAGRLADGEQMTVPENLPGTEMQEIARALNDMSRTVARAIRDLKYEKETMALVLEGLNEGILAVDEQGGILHENEAAWKLLGGDDTPAYEAVMAALREERAENSWDARYATGERILFFAVSRLPIVNGHSRGTVALIRDITEQERLERTRHDYVANISHELRTPLSSIRGLGEGLRDGMVTEEKDKMRYYNIIAEEATRLSRLVNDLLELSSLQSNPAAFEEETVDPNELIYDLHDRNDSLFIQKGLAFSRSLPQDPLPNIRSNEDRLSQALTIFLDNARKYTPTGGAVTIGAEKTPQGVRFFVRDTGIGMDDETKELAFERFHQAERGRSDKGSGLGLAIAREVLQKMGIVIQVKSQLGKGSEFSFTIPAKSEK